MTDRAWLKARRAAKIRQAAADRAYGIAVEQVEGATRLVWDLDRETFGALIALHQLRDVMLVDLEAELVATCRAEGLSWEEIGWALGMRGSSARKRHLPSDVNVRAMLRAMLSSQSAAPAAVAVAV